MLSHLRPALAFLVGLASAQVPAPQAVPQPGPAGSSTAPYQPTAILPGGIVLPLYEPGSKYLKTDRVGEPEHYNMNKDVPGRINSIVNIHNPSIEVHTVDSGFNTGAAIIVIAGGGHRTLNVGSEGADFVPFFYGYGINTIILRNRLRSDGYNPQVDAVHDALEAVRLVRTHAAEWHIDPKKIGVMGFSAGAELATYAAVTYPQFDKEGSGNISARPDFAGVIYPGPSPFAPDRPAPPIPIDVPPSFVMCAGSGDRVHAVWAIQYFSAMLAQGVPNIELHIYGYGRHPGEVLPDGSHMTAGINNRNGIPFGTWQLRFIDWFRDCGFLDKPGVQTKAAEAVEKYAHEQSLKPANKN
ncbi:MAG: alpha/beta hydrolase [Rhodospirillales bacterium]|nr:alpha/beta hydrolase [Acetobacter sp.]